MNEWVSVKEKLPKDNEIVKVMAIILFPSIWEAMYVKKYFVREGENITKWVRYWRPLLEFEKNEQFYLL